MGMFDSLYIELDGRELELQTKLFDKSLSVYRVGDWVAGASPGVRVYFDHLWLDDAGRQVYSAERGGTRQKTVFVVLVQGVFVNYQIHEGELAAQTIEPILHQLQEHWSDSARVRDFLVETLRIQQQRFAALDGRLCRIRSIIATARRLKAGETLNHTFELLHEENKRLAAGEDPFEVIAWALEDDVEKGWSCEDRMPPDPLYEHRL